MRWMRVIITIAFFAAIYLFVFNGCGPEEKKIPVSLLPPLLELQICKVSENPEYYLVCSTTGENPIGSHYTIQEFNQKIQTFFLIDRYEYRKIHNYVRQIESLK